MSKENIILEPQSPLYFDVKFETRSDHLAENYLIDEGQEEEEEMLLPSLEDEECDEV